MAEEKANKPIIRFAGFTDSWEQRKFYNIATRNSVFGKSSPTLPGIEYEDLISGEGLLNKDVANKAATKKGLLFCEGDVLFGKLRPYLHNFYKPSFSGVAIGDFWVLRPVKNIDSCFLYLLIQSPKYDAISNLSAGSKMPRSDWNLVSKTEFSVPENLAEQRKIGNVLSLVDETIVLHQRKLDALKKLKKALLQKMFPAEGEDKPFIRFAGFADSWEQRKFYNIATRNSVFGKSSPTLPGIEYEDLISGEGLLNKDVANKAATKKGLLFCEGDVLFGKLRPYLHNFYKPSFSGVAIGDFWVLRPVKNIDSCFLYLLIQSPKYDAISNLSAGSKMPRSDWNLVSKTEFSVPENLAEQRKIGNVLSLVDETIVLHQRKLDALKKLKKALLQKMFI